MWRGLRKIVDSVLVLWDASFLSEANCEIGGCAFVSLRNEGSLFFIWLNEFSI